MNQKDVGSLQCLLSTAHVSIAGDCQCGLVVEDCVEQAKSHEEDETKHWSQLMTLGLCFCVHIKFERRGI